MLFAAFGACLSYEQSIHIIKLSYRSLIFSSLSTLTLRSITQHYAEYFRDLQWLTVPPLVITKFLQFSYAKVYCKPLLQNHAKVQEVAGEETPEKPHLEEHSDFCFTIADGSKQEQWYYQCLETCTCELSHNASDLHGLQQETSLHPSVAEYIFE